MQVADEEDDTESSSNESEDEEPQLNPIFTQFAHPEDLDQDPEGDPPDGDPPDEKEMSEVEAVLYMLDLMSAHKSTDEQGKQMWDTWRSALQGHTATFNLIKSSLQCFQQGYVSKIAICVNDCIAFEDLPDIDGWPEYRHAHRTRCPSCGEARCVTDPKTGASVPRKVA